MSITFLQFHLKVCFYCAGAFLVQSLCTIIFSSFMVTLTLHISLATVV